MSLIGAWKCKREGRHVVDPDPGDFVLACTRCGVVVDIYPLMQELFGDDDDTD